MNRKRNKAMSRMKFNMMRWLAMGVVMVTAATRADESFKINGDAAKGAETFKMYCVACHGETGKGDGMAASALNPKPKNLADAETMTKISDHEIFMVIRDGGPAAGLSPMMSGWKIILGDDQKVHDVAAYVRTLAKE